MVIHMSIKAVIFDLDGTVIDTNLVGTYNADNVMAAIAVGMHFEGSRIMTRFIVTATVMHMPPYFCSVSPGKPFFPM